MKVKTGECVGAHHVIRQNRNVYPYNFDVNATSRVLACGPEVQYTFRRVPLERKLQKLSEMKPAAKNEIFKSLLLA